MFRLALAQAAFPTGAVRANADRVLGLAARARDRDRAQLVLFPALTLSGGAPQALACDDAFLDACRAELERIAGSLDDIACLVGWPERHQGAVFEAVSLLGGGRVLQSWRRPWGQPPDLETPGAAFRAGGVCLSLMGGWQASTDESPPAEPATLGLAPLAQPFRHGAPDRLVAGLEAAARRHALPIAACNLTGGADSRVFFGGSVLAGPASRAHECAPLFAEALLGVDLDTDTGRVDARDWPAAGARGHEADAWGAVVTGLRDYCTQNGVARAWLGLSGGMDSALVLVAAVEALGPERVVAVRLPSRYTSSASNDLAAEQASGLGVHLLDVPIEAPFGGFTAGLEPAFAQAVAAGIGAGAMDPGNTTFENLQARSRGVILMALANRFGGMVLNTSNKSEAAVGYTTIYGDMVGGYAPIQDLYKTEVFAVARWLNTRAAAPVIPPAVIHRPPSAELREGQLDQDSLPPYAVLDPLLHRHLEGGEPAPQLVAAGFDPALVERVLRLLATSEWKRRQAAPGPWLSSAPLAARGMPLSSGWG